MEFRWSNFNPFVDRSKEKKRNFGEPENKTLIKQGFDCKSFCNVAKNSLLQNATLFLFHKTVKNRNYEKQKNNLPLHYRQKFFYVWNEDACSRRF